MQNFEVGILPQTSCFSFSHSAQVQELFYYHVWCGHYFCNSDYYIKRDTYAPLLLAYICAGTFCVEVEGETHEARAGQVVLLDCSQPHHYYSQGDTEFYCLYFDGPNAHALCHYINQARGVVLSGEHQDKVRQALDELVRFYEEGGSESVFATSARIYQILALLDDPQKSQRLKKNDDSINRAIVHIRSNIGEKITLSQLASLSGLSYCYFSHLFKEMTGQSPLEYMIYARIDHAKVLLANTNLSVAEIAQKVGYMSSGNLIAVFGKRVGCSPNQYRRANRKSTE